MRRWATVKRLHQAALEREADRLQEDRVVVVGVRLRAKRYVKQVATLDVEDDVLEPDAALRLELGGLGAGSS